MNFDHFVTSLNQTKQNIIVSCFYQIDNKHSTEQFSNWISNFLHLQSLKFVFTDEQTLSSSFDLNLSEINVPNYKWKTFFNSERNVVFIILPLTETFVWKHFGDYMKYSTTIDIEKLKGINHNEWLYTIWNNKSWFLLETIQLTESFQHLCNGYYWVDIGSIRVTPSPEISKFISSLKFVNRSSTKIILMLMKTFNEFDLEMIDNVPIIFHNNSVVNRVVGGFFGGGADEIRQWCQLYQQELSLFQQLKLYGGKDQYIMTSILIKNYHLFNIQLSQLHDQLTEQIANTLQLSRWFCYIPLFSTICE